MSGQQVLDRYSLEMRSKVLDVAAALDRIDGAEAGRSVAGDPRLANLQAAIRVLLDGEPGRAARVQMIFSDAYEPDWKRPLAGRS